MPILPVEEILPELLSAVINSPNTVISAPPGAGKTTRIPIALMDVFKPEQGRIIMLEPRRIAAVSAASYMAGMLGEMPGETVGYSIRFERKVSPRTRIEVVTEGLLTRRIQDDPSLEGVACVIFDEFHERSIHADLGLALCLESQAALRDNLKLLAMSATLDCGSVARLLGNAPVVSSRGSSFEVEARYQENRQRTPLHKHMAAVIRQALSEDDGDMLAFLPGVPEIRALQRELDGLRNCVVCPLYGDLPIVEQQRAMQPGPVRRLVLATSIAETSLTIEGVRIVVDSGLSRRLQLDPSTGLERLVTVRESKASAMQRAGRAGRTVPGVCYRLFSQQTFQAMTPFTPPEIMTADLSSLMLELAAWGASDISTLNWLDTPPAPHVSAASELLTMLGAINRDGSITPIGKRMATLPLHPRLARLLVAGAEQGLSGEACRIAAELSGRGGSDPMTGRIERQLLRLIGSGSEQSHESRFSENISEQRMAALYIPAWPDRLAVRRGGGSDSYLLASGRGARLSTGLSGSGMLVALQVDGGAGADGVIHRMTPVTAEQVRTAVPQMLSTKRHVVWDEAAGRVTATEEERIGAVALSVKVVQATDDEAVPMLIEQVRRRGLSIFRLAGDCRQLQGRALLASRFFPDRGLPDLSDEWLSANLSEWLTQRLSGIRCAQQLEQIDMQQILKDMIGWRLLTFLDDIAPSVIHVPSGRRVQLDYTAEDGPVLSVKLQELFGLSESPTVCMGRIAVLIHMLSPAGRPLAVTRDLKGFWGRGYQDVRKEMRGRYPKHPWPEDPWSAMPTARTKKGAQRAPRSGLSDDSGTMS